MSIQNKKIAIIGGGPGGLTLARLLQLKNIDVTVYERDVHQEVRIQGGALDLHDDSGLKALRQAGLIEEFKTHFRPGAEKMRITDQQARIFYDQHLKESKLQFGDKHFRPEIDRGPLRDILLASLKPGTVIWNSKFESLEIAGEGWTIHFENGPNAYADFVIGADGSSSKVRAYVTSFKPIWAGMTMVEGSIKNAALTAPHIHALLKGGKIFAFGDDQTLIVSSKGDGSLGFATGCKTTESWWRDSGIDFNDNQQVLAWFKKEFSGWSTVWQELFEDSQTIFIPRPQYCMPLNQKWESHPNITLLGDAAHWMPPYAGEGVNMAMLDAFELSIALTHPSYATTGITIASYEKKMLSRFEKTGQGTLFNTQWMHQPKALNKMLAMFSSNPIKKSLFIGRMGLQVFLVPFFRKITGRAPKQLLFTN